MKPAFKKRALQLSAFLLFAIYVYRKRSIFGQFIAVIAFASAFTLLLAPLCKRLEQKGLSTSLSAAISVCGLVLTVVLIFSAFIPYLIAHSVDLIRRITPTLTHLLAEGGAFLEQWGLQMQQTSSLTDMIAASMTGLTSVLARSGVALAKQTGLIAFSMVIAYYLLRERTTVANHLILLIPISQRTAFLSAALGCKNAVLGYLSGVLKTSLFVSGATFLGLLILGVRDALLLSLFMGIFEVLPYIGPVLAAIPILLVTLPQGFYHAVAAMALVVLVQQIEGNFVSPYFTASSTSIHPLAALISVFVLGSLFGLWGILLAVPAVVTLRSMYWSVRQAGNLMNE